MTCDILLSLIKKLKKMTNAKPKIWSRTCDAAKWLRKDLYKGKSDLYRDRAHVVQEICLSYFHYTKAIFQQNFKKTIEAFIAVNKIGDEALLQLVEDGKLPNSYKTGKSYVALLLYVQSRCKIFFNFSLHLRSTKELSKKSAIKGRGEACSKLQLPFIFVEFC